MPFLELKWPNDLEGHGQWPPFSILPERIPRCIFGANLVILAQICDELSHGQAEFPRLLSQNGQNDFEGQGQWPPFSIPAESIPGCMFGANLVIPTQICDDLLCGQAEFRRIRSQNDQNDPGCQVQWPSFSIPVESIPGCMFGANLVIPAQIWRVIVRTSKSLRTDGRMDGQTQATTIPRRPEKSRVKMKVIKKVFQKLSREQESAAGGGTGGGVRTGTKT